MNKKIILLILDGWGLGPESKYNAVDNSDKPNYEKLIRDYPNISLRSDGPSVGLPEGQYGTSEINHQVIGSGRVILQDLPKLDTAIENGQFFTNHRLLDAIQHSKTNDSALHLIGIVSDGKVHASLEHVQALIKLAAEKEVKKLYLHVFADGRDSAPKSVEKYLTEINKTFDKYGIGQVATLQGRFYLDRDRDWDKTSQAADLITNGEGQNFTDWQSGVNFQYNLNRTDEFFPQMLINKDGLIKENDAVIFFHYRTDRLYQIVKDLQEKDIRNLNITTFIEISEDIPTFVAFPREEVTHTLAEVLSKNNKKQYHITETEKYTHLTYFFNGGREGKYPREDWELLKSNRLVKPFYNFEPTMRSFAITDKIIAEIENRHYDFIVANYAAPDMVGHTGNYEAAVIAVEAIDFCLGRIIESLDGRLDEYALLVTADHGNADVMWDDANKQPHTQHTTSPVPFILATEDYSDRLHTTKHLADIAPTILDLMGMDKPEVMSGESMLKRRI